MLKGKLYLIIWVVNLGMGSEGNAPKNGKPAFPTSLQLIFTCSLDWTHHQRDGSFVMVLTLRVRRKSWKVFYRMVSRNVSKTFAVA